MKNNSIATEISKIKYIQKILTPLMNNLNPNFFTNNDEFTNPLNVFFYGSNFYLGTNKVIDLDEKEIYNSLKDINYIFSYFFKKMDFIEKEREYFILKNFDLNIENIREFKNSNKMKNFGENIPIVTDLNFAEKKIEKFLIEDDKRKKIALKWLENIEIKIKNNNVYADRNRYINDMLILKDNIFYIQSNIDIDSVLVKNTLNYRLWHAIESIMKWLPSIKI